MSYKIDASDPTNLSAKILPERESRRRVLNLAREMGCEKDMLLLFAKYDRMMKACTDDKERSDIGKLANVEVYKLLGGGGELVVDGQIVCKG
jgi:hypothetical protein